MMRRSFLIGFLGSCLVLGGCSADGNKRGVGAVIGGAVGGVAGSHVGGGAGRTAAIIIGSILGAMLGEAVGQSMDDVDRMREQHALEYTPTGETSEWKNPDTGNHYSITPTETHTGDGGLPCREYESTVIIDGKRETLTGTACRRPDGYWYAVS